MKIIFCGPPHSGKTVMINSLYRLLTTDRVQTIRANADGEGYWAGGVDMKTVNTVRAKGDNTEAEFAEWTQTIHDAKADIVLVDIGGKLQDDKVSLFKAADSFVVLCSDQHPELMADWKDFGEANGCSCLACLTSSLVGEDRVEKLDPIIEGTITQLERGTVRTDSELLLALAGRITKLAEPTTARPLDDETLNAFEMAYALECFTERKIKTSDADDVTLCRNIHYEIGDIPKIREYVGKWQAVKRLKNVKVYGATANWVAMTIVFTLIDGGAETVDLFDIRTWSYVPLRKLNVLAPDPSSILSVKVSAFDGEKDLMDVSILDEHGKPRSLDLDELERCSIPPTDASRGMVVSGRLPIWLLGSICITLPNKEIFVRQPGAGENEFVRVKGVAKHPQP